MQTLVVIVFLFCPCCLGRGSKLHMLSGAYIHDGYSHHLGLKGLNIAMMF